MNIITAPDFPCDRVTRWNVIPKEDFKQRMRNVFEDVSRCLATTLGPYGSTTIIERFGETCITKDGWQVLKNISFDDPIDNNIMMLLVRVSAQVVAQVGDGSTSSIVSANAILKEFESASEILNKYRPKELIDALNVCVNTIVDEIYKNAIPVNKDTFDEIKNIAYISTNGNEEIANMILDIYRKTGNPAIEYVESKTEETTVDIIDGYTAAISYTDAIFTTSDDGNCTVNNPRILMFDYKIDLDNCLDIISAAIGYCRDERCRLIVIAPMYDKLLLDKIGEGVVREYRERGSSSAVYCRVSCVSAISRELYSDFAIMAGGQIIHERYGDDKFELSQIGEYLGHVEKAVIGKTSTLISGLVSRNENMYNKILEDATSQYNTKAAEYLNRGIIDTSLNDIKNRVAKLKGAMGIIRVGGMSTIEKRANYDLVEDAVKACESAFIYGYNVGGSMIIPYVINDILKREENTEYAEIYYAIKRAFYDVFRTIVNNKYNDDVVTDEKVDATIEQLHVEYDKTGKRLTYDLVKDELTDTVVNSCRTDIEILKASVSVVSLLLTSNQYLTIRKPK